MLGLSSYCCPVKGRWSVVLALAGLAGRAECGEVSITIRDYPGGHSKVSVRSGESFDSCALCARFGGGGHKMAAGCNLPVPPLEARELLLRAIDEVLS